MINNKSYACFGGFGPQYWTSITTPTITGKCNELTICAFNEDSGEMKIHSKVSNIKNPSTIVISPSKEYIYVTNEDHDFIERGFGGGVSAFSFNTKTGTCDLINQSLSYGASPAYISIDKTGKYLFVANHGSKFYCTSFETIDGELVPNVIRDEGCICMFSIREDGGVGQLLDRIVLEGKGIDEVEHASAHPHCIIIDEQDYIVVPNKGGDNIYVCKLNRLTNKMQQLSIYKEDNGSSPRHALFVKNTDFVLVQNEYDGHLCSFSLNRKTGELTKISKIDTADKLLPFAHPMLGDGHPWGIDVQIHSNGKFVYTNNTQNVLSLFYFNNITGELALNKQIQIKGTVLTRGIQIDKKGRFLVVTALLNEKALIYNIDQSNGSLEKISEIALPTPTALKFI